jgi:hypothetical protein
MPYRDKACGMEHRVEATLAEFYADYGDLLWNGIYPRHELAAFHDTSATIQGYDTSNSVTRPVRHGVIPR